MQRGGEERAKEEEREGEEGGEGRRNTRKDVELRECILYFSVQC